MVKCLSCLLMKTLLKSITCTEDEHVSSYIFLICNNQKWFGAMFIEAVAMGLLCVPEIRMNEMVTNGTVFEQVLPETTW